MAGQSLTTEALERMEQGLKLHMRQRAHAGEQLLQLLRELGETQTEQLDKSMTRQDALGAIFETHLKEQSDEGKRLRQLMRDLAETQTEQLDKSMARQGDVAETEPRSTVDLLVRSDR